MDPFTTSNECDKTLPQPPGALDTLSGGKQFSSVRSLASSWRKKESNCQCQSAKEWRGRKRKESRTGSSCLQLQLQHLQHQKQRRGLATWEPIKDIAGVVVVVGVVDGGIAGKRQRRKLISITSGAQTPVQNRTGDSNRRRMQRDGHPGGGGRFLGMRPKMQRSRWYRFTRAYRKYQF